MRLVYFGTADFAVPALERLAPHVVLVVTQPDRPKGRKMQLQPSPVRVAAEALGIPVETPERARNPEFVEQIRALDADALVVAAYGQILSTALLESARQGGINLHGSLLPEYRGAAPIQRAIFDGKSVTGVTLMQMDRGMDTGDEIARIELEIGPSETAGELTPRLAVAAADLVADWIGRIMTGDYPRTPQDHDRHSIAPKITKEEAELDFSGPAKREFNRFRAFTPSPGVFFATESGPVRVWACEPSTGSGEPGTVLKLLPELEVACGTGSLLLTEVSPAGKKRMSGRDFANGARLSVGTQLVNKVSKESS